MSVVQRYGRRTRQLASAELRAWTRERRWRALGVYCFVFLFYLVSEHYSEYIRRRERQSLCNISAKPCKKLHAREKHSVAGNCGVDFFAYGPGNDSFPGFY